LIGSDKIKRAIPTAKPEPIPMKSLATLEFIGFMISLASLKLISLKHVKTTAVYKLSKVVDRISVSGIYFLTLKPLAIIA
jgi:hypothetical protein